MKRLREILDWMPIFLFIELGITLSIYFHKWLVLALILGSVIIFAGFIYLLVMGLESGFRHQFPFDYEQHLLSEIAFFTNNEYRKVEYIDPGSEHPGILMVRENSPQIKIILNAPITASDYSVDVCIITEPVISTHYYVKDDLDLKHAKLSQLLEII